MRARSLTLVILVLLPNAVFAGQRAVRPFERVDIGAYGASNVNRNEFHSYWDMGYAGAVDAVTPFYLGRASLLIRVGAGDAIPGAASSGFTSIFGALGLRVGRDIVPRLRTDVGVHIGLTEWIFSGESSAPVRYELELGSEGSLRADYEFASRWHAIAEASYQITFTHERIELAYVSVGLARSFGTPGWMRGILK